MSTQIVDRKYASFTWTDIHLSNKKDIEEIATKYNLDPFQVKDSVQSGHLPKYEKNSSYTFLILRAYTAKDFQSVTSIPEISNKISIFYNEDTFITVHGADFPFLSEIVDCPKNTEDLALCIIQKVIESYEHPAMILSQKVDKTEATVFLRNFEQISLEDIYFQKTNARISKNLLQLLQIVVTHLEVSKSNTSSLMDIRDRLIALIMSYDEVAENTNNLLNTYLSLNSQSNNDVIKLLTVFSAFFLPLTFIVGIYGMNFKYMPEIELRNGYYGSLILMSIVSLIIYLWFKKRKIL